MSIETTLTLATAAAILVLAVVIRFVVVGLIRLAVMLGRALGMAAPEPAEAATDREPSDQVAATEGWVGRSRRAVAAWIRRTTTRAGEGIVLVAQFTAALLAHGATSLARACVALARRTAELVYPAYERTSDAAWEAIEGSPLVNPLSPKALVVARLEPSRLAMVSPLLPAPVRFVRPAR